MEKIAIDTFPVWVPSMEEPAKPADQAAQQFAESGGKGFAARLGRRSSTANPDQTRDAEQAAEPADAAEPPRATQSGAAERARQAMAGMLLDDPDSQGSPRIPIDAKAFRERLDCMSEADLLRLAEFLSTVRATPADGAAPREPPVVDAVEEGLAAHGLNLNMSGKTNTVYVSGPGSTWNVTVPADQEPDPRPQKADGNRSTYRNNWGQSIGRSVKGFIRGY